MRRKDQDRAGPSRRRRLDFESVEDDEIAGEPDDDEEEEDDERPLRAARSARRDDRGRKPPGKRALFPAEDEGDDDRSPRARPRRHAEDRVDAPAGVTLLDLSVPVFGFAALLPTEPTGVQPAYQAFREQVLAGLQRIEQEAPTHGIDAQDAREATYALSVLLDAQVAESEWLARTQWATEPLGMTLHHDPDAGVNFFRKAESFTERQSELKAVYLVCLALGYQGQYAQLPPEERAVQLGEIRRRLLRSLHPAPMDRVKRLFPEAYVEADPIEQKVPPAPGWWWAVSVGAIAVLLLLFLLFYWIAGALPEGPLETLRGELATTGIGSAFRAAGERPC